VDDHPVNLLFMRQLLSSFGLTQVDEAQDGAEALRMRDSRGYDIVFMDCQMPGMGGYETARRWRAAETQAGSSRAFIIAVTANALRDARQACLAAGMDDYISKPVETHKLRQLLAMRRPGHEAPPPPETAAAPSFDWTLLDQATQGSMALKREAAEMFMRYLTQDIRRLSVARKAG